MGDSGTRGRQRQDGFGAASRAVREQADAFRRLVDIAPYASLLVHRPTARIAHANEAAAALLEHGGDALLGLDVRTLCPPEDVARVAEVGNAYRAGSLGRLESARVLTRSGRRVFVDVDLLPIDVGGHDFVAISLRDVTERVDGRQALERAHATLDELEARCRAVVEAASDAILAGDRSVRRLLAANPAACGMFGYSLEELLGICASELHASPSTAAETERAVDLTGRAWLPELRLRRKDGSELWGDLRATAYVAEGRRLQVTIIRDVTDRVERERQLEASFAQLRQTHAQLAQASKMIAIGQLGAGLAHELNQPITIIQGYANRIRRKPHAPVSALVREIDIILQEADRMARIVDNIRTFGRQDEHAPVQIDALRPLDDALMLLWTHLQKRGIRVTRHVAGDPQPIVGDSARLQQVFLNLLLNARDALAGSPDPEIRVSVSATESGTVAYTVEDNGPGVLPRLEARLFDPFFTTKPPGEGSGLGLAVAYGIVADHAGTLAYRPRAGGGACFEARIPVYEQDDKL